MMQVKDLFNNKYRNNKNAFSGGPVEIVKRAMEFVSGGNALLLGVGNGRNLEAFIKNGFHITGVDISDEAVKLVREKYAGNKNVDLIVGDVTDIEFNDKFDVITAIGLLHFLPKDKIDKLIKKMQFITKSGGLNVIAVRMTQNKMNNLPHIFSGNELRELYIDDEWEILFYNEKAVEDRKVASIIARKR